MLGSAFSPICASTRRTLRWSLRTSLDSVHRETRGWRGKGACSVEQSVWRVQHCGAEHGADASAANVGTDIRADASTANVGTDTRADKGADTGPHTHADGVDSCPNCAADSETDAATHRVAVMAAHAATDALPDLRVRTTVRSSLCGPNALADVLPEPRTNDCDADSIAFYCTDPTSLHYYANGPADATLAYVGAYLAAVYGRADGPPDS